MRAKYPSRLSRPTASIHADARDLVEGLGLQRAEIGQLDGDAVLEAEALHLLDRVGVLLLGQRHAMGLDAVMPGRVADQPAPAAADVQHPLAGLQAQLAADDVELGDLRLLQRRLGRRGSRRRYRPSPGRERARRRRSTGRSGSASAPCRRAPSRSASRRPARRRHGCRPPLPGPKAKGSSARATCILSSRLSSPRRPFPPAPRGRATCRPRARCRPPPSLR